MYRLNGVTTVLEGRTRHDPVLGMRPIAPGGPSCLRRRRSVMPEGYPVDMRASPGMSGGSLSTHHAYCLRETRFRDSVCRGKNRRAVLAGAGEPCLSQNRSFTRGLMWW